MNNTAAARPFVVFADIPQTIEADVLTLPMQGIFCKLIRDILSFHVCFDLMR